MSGACTAEERMALWRLVCWRNVCRRMRWSHGWMALGGRVMGGRAVSRANWWPRGAGDYGLRVGRGLRARAGGRASERAGASVRGGLLAGWLAGELCDGPAPLRSLTPRRPPVACAVSPSDALVNTHSGPADRCVGALLKDGALAAPGVRSHLFRSRAALCGFPT